MSRPRLQVLKFCPAKPKCPDCETPSPGERTRRRVLHDLGDKQPVDIAIDYKRYRCPKCRTFFDCIPRSLVCTRSPYTQKVMRRAIELVIEDGLSIREASRKMRSQHHVHVPAATIFNWTNAKREPAAVSILLVTPQPD